MFRNETTNSVEDKYDMHRIINCRKKIRGKIMLNDRCFPSVVKFSVGKLAFNFLRYPYFKADKLNLSLYIVR